MRMECLWPSDFLLLWVFKVPLPQCYTQGPGLSAYPQVCGRKHIFKSWWVHTQDWAPVTTFTEREKAEQSGFVPADFLSSVCLLPRSFPCSLKPSPLWPSCGLLPYFLKPLDTDRNHYMYNALSERCFSNLDHQTQDSLLESGLHTVVRTGEKGDPDLRVKSEKCQPSALLAQQINHHL